MGRIFYFLLTNLAVLVVLNIVMQLFGIGSYLEGSGINYQSLLVFSFIVGMAGSVMPVAVAHGEGRVEFKNNSEAKKYNSSGGVTLRFIDNLKQTTERYPSNPNGSLMGITGVTSTDGRANIMMPHPERVFRAVTNSWHPSEWKEDGPWLRLFRNARTFVD